MDDMTELTHVLLGNHFHYCWFSEPDPYLSDSGRDKLHRHACCVGAHRPNRTPKDVTLLHPLHDCRVTTVGVRLLVPLTEPAFGDW